MAAGVIVSLQSSSVVRCRVVVRHAAHGEHVVRAVESRCHCAVREWNSASRMACQSLDHVMRNVSAVAIDERIDARAVAFATVKRIGKHLANDLVVIGPSDRVLRVLVATKGSNELLGRRH